MNTASHDNGRRADGGGGRLIRTLAWASIAIGAVELARPRRAGSITGSDLSDGWVRMRGLREIATGIALLWADDKTPWLIGRVAGDAYDIATLLRELGGDGTDRARTTASITGIAALTALDLVAVRQSSRRDA